MNPRHEKLLTEITEEYPEEVAEFKEYSELRPPISEEYLRELCGEDEELNELLDDVISYFYRYTKDVCLQESYKKGGIVENNEDIRRMEEPRSALHNSMIDSVRILAKNLHKKGKDVSWFDNIDNKGRAGYAQLALLTTLLDIVQRKGNES